MRKALLLTLLALAFPATSWAHTGISRGKAERIMRGEIARLCPGGNIKHRICFARQDGYIYRSERHCWRWHTWHTHKEGNWPWGIGARWYGSYGSICHGLVVGVREYR